MSLDSVKNCRIKTLFSKKKNTRRIASTIIGETICNQCGKPAVKMINNNPVCVKCYCDFMGALQIEQTNLMLMSNFLRDQADAMTGISSGARFRIPTPVVHKGEITMNDIKISGSVVGNINTGNIDKIKVAMNHIQISGNDELSTQIKEFTEAVIENTEIGEEQRDEIIEILGFLSSQLITETSQRSPSVIKAVLGKINDTLAVGSRLATLWLASSPQLSNYLAAGL